MFKNKANIDKTGLLLKKVISDQITMHVRIAKSIDINLNEYFLMMQ